MGMTASFVRQALRPVSASLCLGCAAAASATDSFNASTGTLTIPTLQVGNAVYSNVVIDGMGISDIVGGPSGSAPNNPIDTYNPSDNQLTIGSVKVGGSTFYNLVVTPGTLVSIGAVSGADTYIGGGRISIPSIQVVGGSLYSDVVISATLGDIVSGGGGLPQQHDTYDVATQELTIAAIDFAGSVRTNVVLDNITLSGNVVSIGGNTTPAVYAVDATDTLFAFDANGRRLASVALPAGSVGAFSGGGITTDANNVYVTTGTTNPANQVTTYGVSAFNKLTLAPVALAGGTFTNVAVGRGIVYDPLNTEFYIANGGADVTIYNADGGYLGAISASVYGPSGAAFDSADGTLWVANYTGGSGINPQYGVAEFTATGSVAQTLNPASTFLAPQDSAVELPYSIGYCAPAVTGGSAYVVVGYGSDSSNRGVAEGGFFTTAGSRVGAFSPQLGATAIPYAISCAPNGIVYVAAADGLHEYSALASPGVGISVPLPLDGFAALTAPVYGVYAPPAAATVTPPPAPAVFAVDSTSTLFSFDASGNPLNKVALGAPVGNLEGGGITVADGIVYVTVGPTASYSLGTVLAFNAANLQPVSLSNPFFGISNPVGIAYDPHNAQFYIASYGGGTVYTFGPGGNYVGGIQADGATSIAYDATNNSLWLASFQGEASGSAIYELNENLSFTQTINTTSQFLPPSPYQSSDDPVAIAYCATSGSPPSTANVVPVAFSGYNSGTGGGAGQSFSTSGSPFGTPYVGTITNPHAMSCTSTGVVFVAADNGLLEYNVTGSDIGGAAGAFPGLTPPVYGVFANY